MSESKKSFSIAALLLMPQFKYCFRGFEHIYPVFIQMMASMFAAADLLPKNHPATRYGTEGVEKYSFSKIVGEAWYYLMRRGAGARSWGIFVSVILMTGAFVAAIVGFFGNIFLGIGTAAQAQIFTLGATDTSGATGSTPSPSALFDKRMVGANSVYEDWGLYMLDKIVRSSAQSPQTGGALQNAMSGLILTYNTAITVVAAVMIFWIIVSVVVDTAKTGILGGGRHNMVWAPIRIVFALGLMIPLGSAGYSSGQYCVMKLAEWGSNLGTNGWTAYVTGVASGNDMLAGAFPGGTSGIINDIAQMRVCQVAYNTYVYQATQPNEDPTQLVGMKNTWSTDGATLVHSYTNKNEASLCGSLQIGAPQGSTIPGGLGPTPARPGDDGTTIVNSTTTGNFASLYVDAGNTAQITSGAASNPIAAIAGFDVGGTLAALQNQARILAANALLGAIPNVESKMLEFACTFVSHEIPVAGAADVGSAPYANVAVGGGNVYTFSKTGPLCTAGLNQCGSGGAPPGNMPNGVCHFQAQQTLNAALLPLFAVNGGGGSIWTLFNNWINGNMTTPTAITRYGWASAGAFYHKVTELNGAFQSFTKPSVSYMPGKLSTVLGQCQNSYSSVGDCDPNGINYRTAMILEEYTRWYEDMSNSAWGAAAAMTNMQNSGTALAKPNGMSALSIGWSILKGGGKALEAVISNIFGFGDARSNFLIDLVGSVSDNTLPLANLSKIGLGLVAIGTYVLLSESVMQGVAGAVGITGATTALGLSAAWTLVTIAAQSFISSGMLLAFYVPILPFMRSAFATLTWMVSIFEAVVMIPIAALAHLTTEGEGLAAGARQCWVMWLNVLTRPVLYIIGFVGAFLVYNAWMCYFTTAFAHAQVASPTYDNVVTRIIAMIFNAVVYVGTAYATANAVFKMVDLIPNALMKWLPGGQVDHSFDDTSNAAAQYAGSVGSSMGRAYGDSMTRGIQMQTSQNQAAAQGLADKSFGAGTTSGGFGGSRVATSDIYQYTAPNAKTGAMETKMGSLAQAKAATTDQQGKQIPGASIGDQVYSAGEKLS